MLSVNKKIIIIIVFSTLISLLLLSSCTKTPDNEAPSAAAPAGIGASCDVTTEMGFCYDYIGPGWTQEKVELDCGDFEESLLDNEPCSQESVIATCNFNLQGDADLAIRYYFYEPTDLKTAEMMCPGTFIPNK
jgi:hypothetical protein